MNNETQHEPMRCCEKCGAIGPAVNDSCWKCMAPAPVSWIQEPPEPESVTGECAGCRGNKRIKRKTEQPKKESRGQIKAERDSALRLIGALQARCDDMSKTLESLKLQQSLHEDFRQRANRWLEDARVLSEEVRHWREKTEKAQAELKAYQEEARRAESGEWKCVACKKWQAMESPNVGIDCDLCEPCAKISEAQLKAALSG